jgi:hypothetical protein
VNAAEWAALDADPRVTISSTASFLDAEGASDD